MGTFFFTEETVPAGMGFSPFGPLHLMWLAFLVVTALVCCRLYKKANEKRRRTIRITFLVLLLAEEVFKHSMLMIADSWLPKYLPLHLCSINLFLIAFHAFHPGKQLASYLYTVSIPAAIAAMLFPTWTCLPIGNFMHLHSFTVHILLAVYPMMLLAGGEFHRDIRQVPKNLLILLGLAAVAFVANLLLDTNFMFLMYAPQGNPLYWFEQICGSHLIGFPILIAGVIAVMFFPSIGQIKAYFARKKVSV